MTLAANGLAGQGEEVARLLATQCELYGRLSQLADTQRAFITGNQPERLLSVLSERQQLIDRLEAVSREFRPYQANWRQVRQAMPAAQGEKVDRLVTEVNAVLAAILKKDEADAALLSARKTDTGQMISSLQAGRRVGAAYTTAGQSGGAGADWA